VAQLRASASRSRRTGCGGIISATIGVDDRRLSPLEYPKLGHDRLARAAGGRHARVQAEAAATSCNSATPAATRTPACFLKRPTGSRPRRWIDLYYGYRNVTSPMTLDEIAAEVQALFAGARRVKGRRCRRCRVTASKGYILHQFLNPATNRRRDAMAARSRTRFRC
jgi:2,4-dienoyl-CoA reductase (NADPH2)